MAQRSYSDEDRANALAALEANGGNITKTARELSIPIPTLRRWATGTAHPEASANATAKKGPLADKLEEVAWALAGGMLKKISKAKLSETAIALGITVEKMRLLRDQSTSNDGDGLTDDERATRLMAILDLARARRDTQVKPGLQYPALAAPEGTADGSIS